MAIVTPMKYEDLEDLVGDFLREPGTTPASWIRYSQDRRQRGIVWAEVMALRHLPDHDCRNLIFTEGVATNDSGVIVIAELSPSDEESFFGVVDIYNIALTPTVHFKEVSRDMQKLLDNRNMQYGHYWYYSALDALGQGQKRQIQLKANTNADYKGVADTNMFMTYKVFPSSYQNTFGAVFVPFERNEELIAMGAAAFVLLEEGDPRGVELEQRFYAGLGIGNDSPRDS